MRRWREAAGRRNTDKREVVPTTKGKRPGFDFAGEGQGIVAGARHLGGCFFVEWEPSSGTALPKESDTHSVAVHGQILDGEERLGHETQHLRLQGARRCGGGGGDLCVARFGDAGCVGT